MPARAEKSASRSCSRVCTGVNVAGREEKGFREEEGGRTKRARADEVGRVVKQWPHLPAIPVLPVSVQSEETVKAREGKGRREAASRSANLVGALGTQDSSRSGLGQLRRMHGQCHARHKQSEKASEYYHFVFALSSINIAIRRRQVRMTGSVLGRDISIST